MLKYFQDFLMSVILISFISCNSSSNRIICEDENEVDYQESVSYFKKELESNPNDEGHLYHLAMSHYKLGEYASAETTFTNLIKINREYSAAYLNRGLCRFFQSNQSGACEDFKSSVEIGFDPIAIDNKKVSQYVQENCSS